MMKDKLEIIQNLTGVNSSKLNYYLELKKINQEVIKQNNRLEIIYQLIKDINIDISLNEMMERVYQRLPSVVPCDLLGLALLENGKLLMTSTIPQQECVGKEVSPRSVLWNSIKNSRKYIFQLPLEDKTFCHIESEIDLVGLCSVKMSTVVVVPLAAKGNDIGILILGSSQKYDYGELELKFVQQLADQLAMCIENNRLYDQVLRGKREWEQTFQAVTDPVLLIDLDYNVLRNNNRINEVCNPTCGSGKTSKCYQMIWGRDEPCENCLMKEVELNGQPAYRRVQNNNGVFDVFYYPVFNEQNQLYSIISLLKDVTEKVKMEAKLMNSAKLVAIGEMAAGVAHELNSPMTVIIGTAQMIMRNLGEKGVEHEWLQDIVNCGLRCKKIIQNLLTFSRQDQFPLGPTDINGQVEKVLSLIHYQINRNNILITKKLAANLPEVTANSHQIQQVLINLLLNARDAMEGVTRKKQITISTECRDTGDTKQLLVSVEDNGQGIPEENLTKIFNPFYTSKEIFKGTGLGLSVSLGIAQAHGGTIEVVSTHGVGSTFSLVLPLAKR